MRAIPRHSAPSASVAANGRQILSSVNFCASLNGGASACAKMRDRLSTQRQAAKRMCYNCVPRIGRRVSDHSPRKRTVTEAVS